MTTPMRGRSRHDCRSTVLAVAAAFALTACGSTVAHQSTAGGAPALGGDGLGGAASGTGTDTSAGVAPGDAVVGSDGAAFPAGTAGGDATPAGTTDQDPAKAPAEGTPRGASPGGRPAGGAPVLVGFMVVKDVGEAAAALGYEGLSTGSGARQAKATADLINASGGLAGRKIVPVVYEFDAGRGDPDAVQLQEACARFFEDSKATAVVSVVLDPVLATCAGRAAAPFIPVSTETWNGSRLKQFPNTAIPHQPQVEAATSALTGDLIRSGWFRPATPTEKVTIGLLTHEEPQFKDVKPLVEAGLRKAGLTLTDTVYMPVRREPSDIGRASTAGRSAALRFSSKGINRVIVVDAGGFGASWFALGASSQSYYPRLGLSSLSPPNQMPEVVPPASLAGAAGIGWAPFLDVPASKQQPTAKRTTECLNAMKEAGEDTTTTVSRVGALGICESASLLAAAWRGGDLTLRGFHGGLTALGSSYASALTFASDFTSSRTGASQFRPLAYGSSCDCFAYTGDARSFR